MSAPSAAELLEIFVASLAELTTEPDLTVGPAVWRLFRHGAGAWAELSLRPVSGGQDAFDAVYEASEHGLHVREVPTDGALAEGPPGPWEIPVEFGGEVVAVFAARPRAEGAPSAMLAALAAAAPGIGLLLVDLAQRRRMRRELGHLRALARLHGALLVHRDAEALLQSAATGLREAWALERVRIFAHSPSGPWPLMVEATLPGAVHGPLRTLGSDLSALVRFAPEPALVRLAPAVWLVPVVDHGPLYGAILLDNSITGSPLERKDDLTATVRALAAAWSRVLAPASELAVAAAAEDAAVAERLAAAVASHLGSGGHLVLWRVQGLAGGARRRERQPADGPGRMLADLCVPRHPCVVGDAETFAALLATASPEAAREVAEKGVDALAPVWRLAGAVVSATGATAARSVARALALVEEAARLHDGAVLVEGDRWEAAREGGLLLGRDAVLRPELHRLDVPGQSVPLTRTEVRILRALASTDGPVAATTLVRRVWPGDRTMGVMNLYPHIHELRRRMTQAWPHGLRIRTLRGQGYVLAAEPADAAASPVGS